MNNESSLMVFEDKSVRSIWNEEQEKWYFSVVDIVSVLTDSIQPKRYWSDLKIKLKKEGNETYENIVQLKMKASDGKLRTTDVADMELVLNMLAETSSTEISKGINPNGFDESKNVVVQGGTIAKNVKEQIEKASGKKVVTSKNAKEIINENSQKLLEE